MSAKIEYSEDQLDIQGEGTATLEIEQFDKFHPHFGNNFMFRFQNGQPQFTIGPHWPLSLCFIFVIIFGTYLLASTIYIRSGMVFCIISIISGVVLEINFFKVFLKNPGINFTAYSPSLQNNACVACKLEKSKGTVHCMDCDICVRGYDHHCPWVGKCIGEDNLSEFKMFLFTIILYFTCNLILVII